MIQRCTNPNRRGYSRYGGRGISIAPEFATFEGFYACLGPCPSGMSLDRIDTNGNYEPRNVRWASSTTQSNNRRSNQLLTHKGETHTVAEWADILNMNFYTLWARLFKYGWTVERALTEPLLRQ